jgi:hypothetical protein
MQTQLVSDSDGLPLGNDPVGAVDLAAHEVLESVVAVEAAPPLPQLRDPRPYGGDGSRDGHGTRRADVRSSHELVAGERHPQLLVGCAPSQPRPPRAPDGHGERTTEDDGTQRPGAAPEDHRVPTPSKTRSTGRTRRGERSDAPMPANARSRTPAAAV